MSDRSSHPPTMFPKLERRLTIMSTFITFAAMTTACAGRAQHETLPRRYDCDATVITATGSALVVDGAEASLTRRANDGDHYTVSKAQDSAEYVEYVLPRDPLLDATSARYGIAPSRDREPGPPLERGVCVAKGGYTDVLRQYMIGASIADVAKLFSLEEDEARKRIGTALDRLRCRYHGAC